MGVQRRLAAAAVASGVALTGALFGTATPAQAVLVPVGNSSTSPYNSASPKSDVAICPTGQVVIDGGGTVLGGVGHVVLTEEVLGPNTVRVTAAEVGTYSGDWSVTAWAICARDDDDDDDEEFEITYALSTTGTATTKTAIATCPAGKKLYGAGYQLLGAGGQVFPSAVRPDAALSQVTVRADARRGFTGEWSVAAYGTCAKPAKHMRLVTARSAPHPAATKMATTDICGSGTHVHGVGAEITGGFGDVVLQSTAPSSNALLTAEARASEYVPVDGDDWSVVAHAICSS